MPTLPVHQSARTSLPPSTSVKPLARPLSQSITALGASASLEPPTVGQPSESPVPGEAECTTAKPRGTQVLISDFDIRGRLDWCSIAGGCGRGGGGPPSSWCGSQKIERSSPAVPLKYGLVS